MNPRNHWKRYTKPERAKILAMLETFPPETVARKHGRTVDGIYKLARACQFRVMAHANRHAGMSMPDVAEALGVQESAVIRWMTSNDLPVITRRVGRAYRSVDPEALVTWLRAGNVYRRAINPPGWEWQEIIREIRADLRWLTRQDVCDLLCLSYCGGLRIPDFPDPVWPAEPHRACPYHYAPADVLAWLEAHPNRQTTAAKRWMAEEQMR